jgi:dienelactone hydrolase
MFSILAGVVLAGTLAGQGPPAPLDTFGYDRGAPLEARDSLLRTEAGVEIRAVSFASPMGGRATGWLFVPEGRGPFAGVVVGHGAPGRVDSTIHRLLYGNIHPNATAIARAGAVVIAIEAPWARREVSPVTFTEADSAFQVQLIIELQRAVDLLVARPDVDPRRLGYVGRSYGGATGALFAGIERRLVTSVLQVGDGGLVSHFGGVEGPGEPPPGMPADRWRRWRAAMSPIEPIRFAGRIAPASVLLQNGREDRAVSVALASALHQAASEPKKVIWYQADHGLVPEATADMLRWLAEHLGTAMPSAPRTD